MALPIRPLFEQKAREHGQAPKNERFQADFIVAVNRSIQELNTKLALSTAIETIEDLDDSIASFNNDTHEYILAAGVTHYLYTIGVGSERADKQAAKAAWDDAIGDYQMLVIAAAVAAESDVIGLGNVD